MQSIIHSASQKLNTIIVLQSDSTPESFLFLSAPEQIASRDLRLN